MTAKSTGDGIQERVTVNLLPRASAALDRASTLSGANKTDTINRALIAYAMLYDEQEEGAVLYIKNADGSMDRVRLI